jgi:hypothetical protein
MRKTELIGLQPMQDISELTFETPYVKYHYPSSLFMLGKQGTGKTELIKKYRENDGIHLRQRFSAFGIQEDLKYGRIPLLFEHPKILGHIVIPDFADLLTFNKASVGSTMQFLCAFTQDGLSPQSTFAIRSKDIGEYYGARGGLVAGINKQGFFRASGKIKDQMLKGGFLDRQVLFSYDESALLTERIFESIKREDYRPDKKFVNLIHLRFPVKRVDVRISLSQNDELGEITKDVTEAINENLDIESDGKRLLKNLITLTKASALRDGRTRVIQRDVDRIRFLSKWMNVKMRDFRPSYRFYDEGD